MIETVGGLKGRCAFMRLAKPERTIYEAKNVIVNSAAYLFARLLSSSTEPLAGVWGLAVGAGGTGSGGWSATQQPDPTTTQISMVSEIKRKQLASVTFLDVNSNPTTAITTNVRFQTILNATTDNITVAIREMGLIGGGTTVTANGGPTDMLTAPYFDPSNPTYNSVVLVNYKTYPRFSCRPTQTWRSTGTWRLEPNS